jgi:hypothetical protein
MSIGLPKSDRSSKAPKEGLFMHRRIFISSLTGLIVTDWLSRLHRIFDLHRIEAAACWNRPVP